MKEFLFIVYQITAVFIAFFLGYLLKKFRKEKIDLDTISELIIYLGSPCLVFAKISSTRYSFAELGLLSSAMVFLFLGGAGLSYLVSRLTKLKINSVFYVATMFMNTANIGFPVTLFVLGPIAFQKALILDLALVLGVFSLGVGLISGKYFEWLKIPVIYAALAGFIVSFNQITLPSLIIKPVSMLGEIAVPLMIVSLGCKIAELKAIASLKLPIVAVLIRSLGGFCLGLIFVKVFQIGGITAQVILLYSALPAPVMAYILAQKYHQDEKMAAETVLFSNFSALLILPIVLYFGKLFF